MKKTSVHFVPTKTYQTKWRPYPITKAQARSEASMSRLAKRMASGKPAAKPKARRKKK